MDKTCAPLPWMYHNFSEAAVTYTDTVDHLTFSYGSPNLQERCSFSIF